MARYLVNVVAVAVLLQVFFCVVLCQQDSTSTEVAAAATNPVTEAAKDQSTSVAPTRAPTKPGAPSTMVPLLHNPTNATQTDKENQKKGGNGAGRSLGCGVLAATVAALFLSAM